MKKVFKKIKNVFKKLSFKRLGGINSILLLTGVLLIFMLSVVFGYGFKNNSLIVASSKEINETYYFLEAGKSLDYSEAQTLASNIQEQGGAGYIYYDEGFRVFWAGYTKYENAKAVCEKNSSLGLTIYSVSIKNIDFSNGFSQNLNQVLKSNLVCYKNCIEGLENIINQYEKNEMTEIETKNNCLLLIEEAEQQNQKFLDTFYQNATLYKLKSYYIEFIQNLKNITTLDLINLDFSRTLRFSEISCMFCLKKISEII